MSPAEASRLYDQLERAKRRLETHHGRIGETDERSATLERRITHALTRLGKIKRSGERDRARRSLGSRDRSENPVPKAMRIIRLYHEQGRSWDQAARLFMRNHPSMALETMDRVGSYPSSDPELRALQRVW